MNATFLNNKILPLDKAAMEAATRRWNSIAKPVGSLGVLEDAVTKLAGITGSADVLLDKRAVIVLCADNGVLAQGVAQTPGEITAAMAGFIARRRSSVCIMAKRASADVISVDMGMFRRVHEENLIDRHIADGTKDMTQCAAMTRDQAEQAINTGMELVRDCSERGYQILATGEMGIGNTTTSSAVASVLLGRNADEVTGRGAGLSNDGLTRKISAIKRAIEINSPDCSDALDVLSKVGGFDIAGLCGVFIGGAIYRVPVLIDGFISAVAALAATRLCPRSIDYMLPSHVSAEPGSALVMEALGLKPVIHAGMRLGEGTGAVALLPIIDMALTVYHDLMTFTDIGMQVE